MKGLGN